MKIIFLFIFLILAVNILPVSVLAMDLAPATTTPVPVLVRNIDQPVHVVPLLTAAPIGAISISSTPSGAQVIIDGAMQGTTPFTIRTLTAGTHALLLEETGYQDYTTSITITANQLSQKSYTLVPVVTITPAAILNPVAIQTVVPNPTTSMPTLQLPGTSLSAQLRFPEPVSISPVTVRIGNHTKTIRLTTLSPYFDLQLSAAPGTNASFLHLQDAGSMPTSYMEVDSHNVYLPGSHVMSSAEMANDPVWGDNDTVRIDITDRFFNNTNFRWLSGENGVTAFYQVSRYPFDSNASHWQNQYVPGLVASGPAKDIHVDSENFHYFSLNFAPIANHNPADPPFYTGLSHLEETVPGKGTPMALARIPLTGAGVYMKKVTLGPLSFPVPAGFTMIPAGESTEQELGNPNENMVLSTAGISSSNVHSAVESALMELPQTFYVRIVPMHSDGTAGIPSLPVTVKMVRPKPCPLNPPANSEIDIVMRPPSATVASFYMTSFIPDWIHTDQDGKLVSRAHFVTVSTPPYCKDTSGQSTMTGSLDAQMCAQYGGSQPGYHFYADPAEDHWYDTVWNIITSLFSAWGEVIHAVSVAWNDIQNIAANLTAIYLSNIVLLGLYHCEDHPTCVDVIHTADSAALAAFGVPPTIPDVSDLEGMGADYLAKISADELGAGGVLDTAEDVYADLPNNVKQGFKDHADDVGHDLSDSLSMNSGSAAATAAGGNFYIPDPLYYQSHPAMVMVKVFNPNGWVTDPVWMVVGDSSGLFKEKGRTYIPALKPHESVVIPVILEEDYTKVFTNDCNGDSYTSTCGDICVPCYWNNWYYAVKATSDNGGGDTFSAAFIPMDARYNYGELTPSSSGEVLSSGQYINIDDQGNVCGPPVNVKAVLKYPDFWQMQENSLNQNLWSLCWLKYSFTEGDKGRLIGG
jgi:hypothetical protein